MGFPEAVPLQQDFQSFQPLKYLSYINKPDFLYFYTENPLNCLLKDIILELEKTIRSNYDPLSKQLRGFSV